MRNKVEEHSMIYGMFGWKLLCHTCDVFLQGPVLFEDFAVIFCADFSVPKGTVYTNI